MSTCEHADLNGKLRCGQPATHHHHPPKSTIPTRWVQAVTWICAEHACDSCVPINEGETQ